MLAAVLLAIALAVLWMSKEIARTRRIRDLNAPPPATNQSAPPCPRGERTGSAWRRQPLVLLFFAVAAGAGLIGQWSDSVRAVFR